MRHNTLEAILGAFVLFFVGFFLLFAYKSNRSGASSTYNIIAKFDRVDGLVVGNDVKISGVKVGSIQQIEIEPSSYRAKIVISIDTKIRIPHDSSTEIVSESLLGGKYVAIIPGISPKFLANNSKITKTRSSVNLESLLSKFIFNSNESSESSSRDSDEENS